MLPQSEICSFVWIAIWWLMRNYFLIHRLCLTSLCWDIKSGQGSLGNYIYKNTNLIYKDSLCSVAVRMTKILNLSNLCSINHVYQLMCYTTFQFDSASKQGFDTLCKQIRLSKPKLWANFCVRGGIYSRYLRSHWYPLYSTCFIFLVKEKMHKHRFKSLLLTLNTLKT